MRKRLFMWLMTVVVLLGCGARQPVADDPAAERAVAPPSGLAQRPGTVASADGVESSPPAEVGSDLATFTLESSAREGMMRSLFRSRAGRSR